MDPVVIDTNLLVLLVVGSASRDYIARHKRLDGYTVRHFDDLVALISVFSEIVLLPQIVAEVSNLVRQIEGGPQRRIQSALRTLIENCREFPAESLSGALREEFLELGITDSVVLHFCSLDMEGLHPTLITSDSRLADVGHSLGYSIIDYKQEFM
jgi:hypothetical protein